MKFYIANDHAGYTLKNHIKDYLFYEKHNVIDLGSFNENRVDYPDFAQKCANKVSIDTKSLGVLICGSGIGMSISANRIKGVRAALCHNENFAKLSKAHNNANILCLGARFTTLDEAIKILNMFITTEFESNRHQTRLNKIELFT